MPAALTTGCMLRCSFGLAPCVLVSPPLPGKPTIDGLPVALMTDMVPLVNIATFGACTTPSNPLVAAATSAALGVLTPAPCMPVIPAPWAPPSVCVTVSGVPVATMDSKAACTYGGLIEVVPQPQIVQV